MNMDDKLFAAILGACVGDALGVPVEFMKREIIQNDPVVGMRGYGSHDLPPGTWSDDTSMTLCLLDSLAGGLDYMDIMQKFCAWAYKGEYTPYGKMFGIGQGTMQAIFRFSKGAAPLDCGGREEKGNGNGSLMRIMPITFFLRRTYGNGFMDNEEAMKIVHNLSALTHSHKRTLIACGIYVSVAGELLNGNDVKIGLSKAKRYYESKQEYVDELNNYCRIFDKGFSDLPQKEIKSSGYVVDTLEASLWCLMNSGGYKSCVLKAVNLGGDTDTIAAVAGGLAGILYGLDEIPPEWTEQIPRLDYIKNLCEGYIN